MTMRCLDLFCGAGGAARGYTDAGFRVTGVDIHPQPRYAGDEFIQADAIEVLRQLATSHDGLVQGPFDLVHASPPCQDHSVLAPVARKTRGDAHGTGWMLSACQDLVPKIAARWGAAWVIENVPGADMPGHVTLCGTGLGLAASTPKGVAWVRRHRWFQINFPVLVPSCACKGKPYLCVYGHGGSNMADARKRRYKSLAVTGPGTAQACRDAMGIDWMTRAELDQAVPPAYTHLIGEQAAQYLETTRKEH